MMRVERRKCSVLIIGGGIAALLAAREAAKSVDDVVVVCKRKVGRSGNTLVANGGFAAVIPSPGSEDSPDVHFRDTLAGGRFLNDESLVRVLVEKAGEGILELERLGVPFVKMDGQFFKDMVPGYSYGRSVTVFNDNYPYAIRGKAILDPLRQQVQASQAIIVESTPIVKLLTKNGTVYGAMGVDLGQDSLVQFEAKAVVLACGGAGRIYAQTNNTSDVTGDAYGLALDAGATLRDMEFVQFFSTFVIWPLRCHAPSTFFPDGGLLRNRSGERFMVHYDPQRMEMATRDVMARAIITEVGKGNGVKDGVYLDLTKVDPGLLNTKYGTLVKLLRPQQIDLTKDFIVISPTAHFFMGGVKIDVRTRSDVAGLFVAGEAAGGLHGANRIPGNALSEGMVFGPIAGREAAAYARESLSMASGGTKVIDTYPKRESEVRESVPELRNALQQIMWAEASIVRSASSLQKALDRIAELKTAISQVGVGTPRELAEFREFELMLDTAEAVVRSARTREESRGAHYREDIPTSDDRWLGRVEVRRKSSALDIEFCPAR